MGAVWGWLLAAVLNAPRAHTFVFIALCAVIMRDVLVVP